jgi:hypothetical protein
MKSFLTKNSYPLIAMKWGTSEPADKGKMEIFTLRFSEAGSW